MNKEHNLCHYRITWTLASQTMLFATFFLIKINKGGMSDIVEVMSWLIPSIAILIIILETAGIFGAVSMMEIFETERTKHIKKLNAIFNTQIPDTGVERMGILKYTRTFGKLSYYAVPLLLIVAWVVLLATRFQIGFSIKGF